MSWLDTLMDLNLYSHLSGLSYKLLQHKTSILRSYNETHRCQSRCQSNKLAESSCTCLPSLQSKQTKGTWVWWYRDALPLEPAPGRAGEGCSSKKCGWSWPKCSAVKKRGHRSQSHTLHGGVTPATNENHPASSLLCSAAILALSCACLVSKVKTIWTDGLCAAMWPRLEEYRKHCLSIHSWCHQTCSRCEFGLVTQMPACNLGLFLTVADCCNMG